MSENQKNDATNVQIRRIKQQHQQHDQLNKQQHDEQNKQQQQDATVVRARRIKQQQKQHDQQNKQQQQQQQDGGDIKRSNTQLNNINNSNKNNKKANGGPGGPAAINKHTTPPLSKENSSNSVQQPQQKPQQQQQQQRTPSQNTIAPTQKKKSQQTTNQNNKSPSTVKEKEKERAERERLVLWLHPVKTVKYCSFELLEVARAFTKRLLEHRILLAISLVLATILSVLYYYPGPHQQVLDIVRKNTWFFVYWIGLGVLSSVGLGTGLHTFLLYLGPHIASVTLAAYECNSLDFPNPPYPDDIICPDEPYLKRTPNIWSIMSKVRLESFLWGAGTALGELPPYFMAKAARLSGYDPDDAEEMAEFEALKAKRNQKGLSLMDKGKLFMERVVERIGFFGILACASIPNPLFDLAGITCGHFLVPFWTFFGATLIGKAVLKMHLQKIFIIIAFNENLIESAVDKLGLLPIFGKKLQEPFKGFLENQKHRLHRHRNAPQAEAGNMLSKIFESFVIAMVCYFVVSIVNSLAQSYHKRIHKKPLTKKQKKMILKD